MYHEALFLPVDSMEKMLTLVFQRLDPLVLHLGACNIRSPLMRTLGRSVEMLDRECSPIGFCAHLNINGVANET